MATQFVHNGVLVTAIEGPYVEHGQLTIAAVEYLARLVESFGSLRELATDRLLSLYNDNWLDANHAALDRPTFLSRLTNPSVTLYDTLGAAVVYFEASDMFAGHHIEVAVKDGAPEHVALIG
jgi:hypothetical protein